MLFKILHIRNSIKEARANPGNFASGQARDVIFGIVIIPAIIVVLGLVFLFMLGFTSFLGGPYILFKIIFFIGLIVSYILGLVIYKITSVFRNTTKRVVNKTVEEVRNINK